MSAPPPAWFGKLPCVGDFAGRRMAQPVVDVFDAWLSSGLVASAERLAERWRDIYLTGPLWRFALAPGCIDGQWWSGVLMPSCDGVGRYYPLVVAEAGQPGLASAASITALDTWYASVAEAMLRTLQPTGDLDRFETDLARIAWPGGEATQEQRAVAQDDFVHALVKLGVERALASLAGGSVWWSVRQGVVGPPTVTTGLPDAQDFARLLEGTW